jgi:predicted nuclease of predicted toxin-antitoxin system
VRVLLDESLPRGLARELTGHTVDTVTSVGWAGLTNGELLAKAHSVYAAFITMDANLPYQQALARFEIAVILLRAKSNRLDDLRPLIPAILEQLQDIKAGQVRTVGA